MELQLLRPASVLVQFRYLYCGSAWHVVHERELSEAASVVVCSNQLLGLAGPDEDVVLPTVENEPLFPPVGSATPRLNPLVYDVEIVPVVARVDDVLPLDHLPVEHGVEYLPQLMRLEGAEEQDVLHGLQQALPLDVGLRMDDLESIFFIHTT